MSDQLVILEHSMTLTFNETSVNGQPAFTVQGNTNDLLRLLVKTTYNAAMWLIIMKMTASITPVAALELAAGTDTGAGMTNPPLTFPANSRSFVERLAQALNNPSACQLQ